MNIIQRNLHSITFNESVYTDSTNSNYKTKHDYPDDLNMNRGAIQSKRTLQAKLIIGQLLR